MRFGGQQLGGYPHHPQQTNQPLSQQINVPNIPTAKWHIPQSVQQMNGGPANQSNQSTLAMQFCANGRANEISYKIPLKSPSTLKTSTNVQNGASVVIPSTVTSTNPKTPSPSTNDVSVQIRFFTNL